MTSAVEVVRMDIQIGATPYALDLELYDAITPVTVANFLNYVDDGNGNYRYDQSFINRSVADTIIQGGGYIFDPLLGNFVCDCVNDLYPGGIQPIAEDAPIINEFLGSGLSNVRGTIAMARSGGPDTATRHWYINQTYSSFLDGFGYTVFGHVLDGGMDIVDQIATVPIFDMTSISERFAELPLYNYVSGDPVTQDNLVRINSVRSIQRPILQSDTDSIEFPLVVSGNTVEKTINISNAGNADLIMDNNSLTALTAPFEIISETCSNNTLSPVSVNPLDTCSITIAFSPIQVGVSQSNLEIIPSVNPHSILLALHITGEGVPNNPVLSVQGNITSLDYSSVILGASAVQSIVVENKGSGSLNLSSVMLTGLDTGSFLPDSGCTSTTSLLLGEICTLNISFIPQTEGQKVALLSISSNAGSIDIDLNGVAIAADLDNDGISDSEEQNSPNNGDANNDGWQDHTQQNVASFITATDKYASIISPPWTRLYNVSNIQDPSQGSLPVNASFLHGIFQYNINIPNPVPGSITQVGLLLPEDDSSNKFYIYGSTPDNPVPHWYDFSYNGSTGAEHLGKVTITAPDGSTTRNNMFILYFIDGQQGDGDLTTNGEIKVVGATASPTESSDSSGSMTWYFTLLLAILLSLPRTFPPQARQ